MAVHRARHHRRVGRSAGRTRAGPPGAAVLSTAERRRRAVRAGLQGDRTTAEALRHDDDGHVRALALGALARLDALGDDDVEAALGDPAPVVRRRAIELAAERPSIPLLGLLDDADDTVVELATWALGERSADDEVVARLVRQATEHDEQLCREAAIAALGSLGDPAGLDAVLAGTIDKPAVRRRAVVSLAAFEGPEVEAALRSALDDRDWQVRQAAEDLLDVGRADPTEPGS
ncbi:MAG: HEAT repeat domain-containing protein [Actinomycetota bacterium]